MDKKEEMALIGGRLKDQRLRAGVTQEEAAEIAGVSRSTVSNWEAGRHLPCLIQFRSLCARYGISGYKVLFGSPLFQMTSEESGELLGIVKHATPALRRKVDVLFALMAAASEPASA